MQEESTIQNSANSVHKISFSFELHKQALQQGSAELYQALRTMSWHAKTVQLATDEGLLDLTQKIGSNSLADNWLKSFTNALLSFTSISSLLYVIGVTDPSIKWPIALFAFLDAYVLSVIYHICFKRNNNLNKAVQKLALAFEKDVANLL